MKFTDKEIAKLEEKGFKRWTKGTMDRLYINADKLGLECEYYKTGNIRTAWVNGGRISNCEARRLKAAKTYLDIKTGEVHSDKEWMKETTEKLINGAIGK